MFIRELHRCCGIKSRRKAISTRTEQMTEFSDIPVLDLASLISDADTSNLAVEFAKVYSETGFSYVVNHGVDPSLRVAVFAAAKRFHALPEAEKKEISLNHLHRGYIAINTSTDVNSDLAEVTKPNQSSSFMMMREDAEVDPNVYLSGPNQWPELIGFREACEVYVGAMTSLGYKLMRLALEAIGAKDHSILNAFQLPTIWLRLLHYPPQSQKAPRDLFGSAPHKDFGCLTLLAQDEVGGLQVKTPSGVWVDAPPIENTFVVNVGDMLHRMSNEKLLSTPHRVINATGTERYSVPFFFDPHVTSEIVPLPGTGKPKFEPLNFGAFLRSELEAGYNAHQHKNSVT